jgi:hypothetical protein
MNARLLVAALVFILAGFFFQRSLLSVEREGDDYRPRSFPLIGGDHQLDTFEVEEVIPKKSSVDKYSRTVVTDQNLVFHIAPDRPLEKYAAYLGPISMDSYIHLKFKELAAEIDRRFTQMDWRLSELEKNLSEIKALLSRPQVLMPQGSQPETPAEPTPREETSKFL